MLLKPASILHLLQCQWECRVVALSEKNRTFCTPSMKTTVYHRDRTGSEVMLCPRGAQGFICGEAFINMGYLFLPQAMGKHPDMANNNLRLSVAKTNTSWLTLKLTIAPLDYTLKLLCSPAARAFSILHRFQKRWFLLMILNHGKQILNDEQLKQPEQMSYNI